MVNEISDIITDAALATKLLSSATNSTDPASFKRALNQKIAHYRNCTGITSDVHNVYYLYFRMRVKQKMLIFRTRIIK